MWTRCILMVEPIADGGRRRRRSLPSCTEQNAPALLVINKIDTVEKEDAAGGHRRLQAPYHDFDAIIPISAKQGDGRGGAAGTSWTSYAAPGARSSSRTI